MAWRYFATRLHGNGTETLLVDDLPLEGVEILDEISGPGGLTAKISPEYARLKGPDGLPILRAWSSAIYAEKDGQIRGGGILTEPVINGPDLSLDCVGFSDYARDMPYTASYSKLQIDPLDVVRHIWSHLQGKPNGNLGLVIDDTTSKVRLGTPEDPKLTAAKEHLAYMQEQYDYTVEQEREDEKLVAQYTAAAFRAAGIEPGGAIIVQKSAPTGDKRSKKNLWIEGTKAGGLQDVHLWTGSKWVAIAPSKIDAVFAQVFNMWDQQETLKGSKAIRVETKKELSEAKSRVSDLRDGEAVPYTLSWWETDDLSKEIDDLAAETPFEYRVRHYWSGDTIAHVLDLGHPRLGRRLTEPRFAVGENVLVEPSIVIGGEEYADEVLVLGAGEGRAMVRGEWASRGDRLRRVAVIEAKDVRKKDAAAKLAEREVNLRAVEPEAVDSISVFDHPNAPIGTFAPGDEILLITPEGWTGELRAWYRITAVSIAPDDNKATLSIIRAEKVR